jgi:two-component system, OmpR family, response regulator
MHILLIEDDAGVAEYIGKGLSEGQHSVEHISDGRHGLAASRKGGFDAMIIDRMLPELNGLSIIEDMRSRGDKTPVLILSALGEVDDRVKGLRAGGDDYLVKPFAFAELLARLEAIQRRQQVNKFETRLKVADLEMDMLSHRVTRGGQVLTLQPREYKLLEYMMRHAGQVVTRAMLLENVWDYHFDPQTNVIDVHISRLRQKIDRDFDATLLTTVRGAGYLLQDPGNV